jgi:hypothetical protein
VRFLSTYLVACSVQLIKFSWVSCVARDMAQYSSSLEEPCIPMPRSRIPRLSLQLRVADVALRASGGVFLHVYLKWVLSRL